MKVVCESCQAKYLIPDERVAGKKLKIRCRKCQAAIIVRGDQGGAEGTPSGRSSRGSSLPALAPMAVAAASRSVAQASAPKHSSVAASAASRLASPELESAFDEAPLKLVAEEKHALVAPPVADAGDQHSEYGWYSSVDGAEHGPMDQETLVQWLITYPTAWDAHVWRDGLGDWVPARYLDNLVDEATALVGKDVVAAALEESARAAAELQEESSDALISLAPQASISPATGGYEEAMAAGDVASAFTGARHEESVLFSAGSLRKVAGASAPPSSDVASSSPFLAPAFAGSAAPQNSVAPSQPPASKPGFASGDGSGIVDIRALAAIARASSSAPAAPSVRPEEPADSLLSLSFSPLDSLAPVMQPTSNPPRRGAGLPIAIVAASSLVAAAVIAVAVLVRQAPDTANQDVLVPAATAMATQPPATAPIAVQPQAALPLVQPGPSIAAVEQPAIEEPKEATAVAATTRHAKWRRKDSPSADRDGTAPEADSEEADEAVGAKAGGPVDLEDALATSTETSKPEAEEPSSTASMDDLMTGNAPASSAAAAPAVKEPAKDRSIDELLDVAVSESNGSKAPAASAKAAGSAPSSASLPMQPTRDQVMVAMRGVTPSIQRCASQYGAVGGVAKVKFSIQGSNGTVSAADVSGVGGSAAACIANAAKSAKFSPFQKPMFSVNFPFSL